MEQIETAPSAQLPTMRLRVFPLYPKIRNIVKQILRLMVGLLNGTDGILAIRGGLHVLGHSSVVSHISSPYHKCCYQLLL